jgi:DNA-binding transcriptional MerR regulator
LDKSIVQLRTAAANAALPLDDFAQLIGKNSQSISALFGSTTVGAQRIAELGRITREVGIDRLAPLGFTVDEINETLLLNLESQRRTGVLANLTDRQRTQSAIRFAEELDRLAKLTGQQRDELRAQIEQQQSNERFQAALQGATEETRTRLQGFAATVGNIAPGLNEGFQDLIANAGVPVTESALALVQNIPEAQSIIRSLINGTVSAEQALGQIRDASTQSIDRFRQATVTGQVEFLRLQGDVINLGRRIVDVDGAFADQNAQATV